MSDSQPQQGSPVGNRIPARLRLELLNLDGGTQVRAAINEAVVEDYREAMQRGIRFPPVVAFFDGQCHWLADGFHRVRAAAASGREECEVDLRQGTREDAIWYACAANQAHGLRRSNADKRRAVEVALRSRKAQPLSDRAIAEHCGVAPNFVGQVRRSLQLSSEDSCPRLGRDGKARATSSAKRSEAAHARAERRREPVEESPPVPPPSPAPRAAPPPPLVLSLFGPEPSVVVPMRARRRRKMPLRRVLGAALMLSSEEQQALRRQMKWHVEDEESGSEGSLSPTSGGDRGTGCL